MGVEAATVSAIIGGIGTLGGLFQQRKAGKAQARSQRDLVAQQRKVQDEERARLSQEEAVQSRREASRTRTLRGRLRRGRGLTLFGGQTGVSTSHLGGGS